MSEEFLGYVIIVKGKEVVVDDEGEYMVFPTIRDANNYIQLTLVSDYYPFSIRKVIPLNSDFDTLFSQLPHETQTNYINTNTIDYNVETIHKHGIIFDMDDNQYITFP